jgi:hypothetical protein
MPAQSPLHEDHAMSNENLQIPHHSCLTKEDVEATFGAPGTTKVLGDHKAKSQEYGDPIARDFMAKEIAPVQLRGFGPNHQVTISPGLHRSLHGIVAAAFDEIYARKLPYILRASETVAPTYFRYTKNDNVKAAIAKRTEYGFGTKIPEDWAGICARWDRDNNDFEWEVPYWDKNKKQDVLRPKKDLLSNHSWGTAFDLNPSTNPFKAGAPFDMQIEIVKILEAHGFYWGGRYHDYMHFEHCLPRPSSWYAMPRPNVCFPFGRAGERESPTKYLHLNESGRGGFYPLGLRQNLHGGIHLDPDLLKEPPKVKSAAKKKPAAKPAQQAKTDEAAKAPAATAPSVAAPPEPLPPPVPVRAGLPGYIVAARLVAPAALADKPLVVENLEGQPLGFVLVRHEIAQPEKEKTAEEESGDEEEKRGSPRSPRPKLRRILSSTACTCTSPRPPGPATTRHSRARRGWRNCCGCNSAASWPWILRIRPTSGEPSGPSQRSNPAPRPWR